MYSWKKSCVFFLLVLVCGIASAQSPTKRPLIEFFTSTACGSCANGHLELDKLLVKYPTAIPVAVHSSIFDPMKIGAGWKVFQYYAGGTPMMIVNRSGNAGTLSSWDNKIQQQLAAPAICTTEIDTFTYDQVSRELRVQVTTKFHGDPASPLDQALNGPFTLNLYLLENNVTGDYRYSQRNYYDEVAGHPLFGLGHPIVGFSHQHVLRKMVGGSWGRDRLIPNEVYPGQEFSHEFVVTVSEEWDPFQMELVAVTHRFGPQKSDREILNSDYRALDLATPIDYDFQLTTPGLPRVSIAPNPVQKSGKAVLQVEGFRVSRVKYKIFAADGREVMPSGWINLRNRVGSVSLPTDELRSGLYVAQVFIGEQVQVLKFLVY